MTTMDVIGRWNDGSDDSSALPRVAEVAVILGRGKLMAIEPVRTEVGLGREEQMQSFMSSHS